MKKTLLLFLIVFLFLKFLSAQSVSVDLTGGSKDQLQTYHGANQKIDYIIWGIYFGMCTHDCSTMYQYKMMDSNFLFVEVDPTNSYFNNHGKSKYWSRIIDSGKLVLVADIVNHIPNTLLTTAKTNDRFGCPDCADQGGIYFEISINGKIKTFLVDTNTSQLSSDIKIFADYLMTTINKLQK